MLPRSCSAYSRRLQVCVESLTRPERVEDLLVLTLRFTAPVGLGARQRGSLQSRVQREPTPQLACTQLYECLPFQARRMCLIAPARTPTTKKTPCPRYGPRCSTRALPKRASQSIEDRLHHEMCHAVSQPRLFRTSHCRTTPPAQDATGSQEASVPTWNSRMLWQFGESSAREPSLPPPSLN